jgi:hypothetical protein
LAHWPLIVQARRGAPGTKPVPHTPTAVVSDDANAHAALNAVSAVQFSPDHTHTHTHRHQ